MMIRRNGRRGRPEKVATFEIRNQTLKTIPKLFTISDCTSMPLPKLMSERRAVASSVRVEPTKIRVKAIDLASRTNSKVRNLSTKSCFEVAD